MNDHPALCCPRCKQPMSVRTTEPSYDYNKRIEYQRTRFHCATDDTWGRIEIPIGPMQELGGESLSLPGQDSPQIPL